MAIRSGAGTGVIVSLVVFVLTTVFLLVLSIVFYVENREQLEHVQRAEVALNEYATSIERAGDSLQQVVAQSKSSNQSVSGYFKSELSERNKWLSGNPEVTLADLQSLYGPNINANNPISLLVKSLQSQVKLRDQELKSTIAGLASAQTRITALEDEIKSQADTNTSEVQLVKSEWKDVHAESEIFSTEANAFFAGREQRLEDVRDENIARIQLLSQDVTNARTENLRLESTIADLRDKFDTDRMNTIDPALLVDGTVLEVGTGSEVFIDRGSNDRIVLGMRFDIYDSSSQLRANSDGEFPRGKASIEIVKVGKTTSTAKIIRSSSSQPIVRDNIIVNPIYDPSYKYSFLVHGNYDADGDGNADASNKFIVDLIQNWGGVIVEDEGSLPGDLDFLVLGIAPKKPIHRPGKNATIAMYDDYARQQRAYKEYNELLEQAQSAKIPVLTSNRLYILTGQRR
ncbi:MAG: hypothetical protein HOI88_06195 [Phycisphaerae bacterium]|nr:hypothetical protein [Phycisphaerae bacterium]MBT5365200.1 hypothetical protein [Phycisphaerae bacterium]MBT6269921.1 hypothetical protein [Phycisphaerae bacterium]MBT6282044.1 hypothetical protein [Phycisphaerae bacterium]